MNGVPPHTRRARGGFAYVLAMVLLAMFATMAVAVVATTGGGLQQAYNTRQVLTAQLAAESGLEFMARTLRDVPLPPGATQETLVEDLVAPLSDQMTGTGNLDGGSLSYADGVLRVPWIRYGAGDFRCRFEHDAEGACWLVVTGRSGAVQRVATVALALGSGQAGVFDYGIAARGPVRMTGNAKILGADEPEEAKVLSATSTTEAFDLTGNVELDYDIYASSADAEVDLTGNVQIAGHRLHWADDPDDPAENIYDHIHTGIGDVEFPEPDASGFAALATNLVDASTPTNGNRTFENIRIAAGTNPTFSGNITIRGVVYIEQPNDVRFTGNLNLTGVIVTDDAGDDTYDTNRIRFTGNTHVEGVDALPDTPPFATLKTMPGTFLLAPGFGVEFRGNFGTVNGCMAAEKFSWTGNASGTVRGGIISYSDEEFKLVGNSRITIDRDDEGTVPPGFTVSTSLRPQPDSYRENEP